jgi:hypothetical protein
MVKKNKTQASEKVVTTTKTRIVDYKKQHLDQFYSESKGKFLWLEFNEICFLRVKVLESGDHNAYENILVKVIKTPKWIEGMFGTYLSGKGVRKEWGTAKAGTKIWVNSMSLYKTPRIMGYVEEKQKEIIENFSALKKQIQFTQKSLEVIKDVLESFSKAPDYPHKES